MIVNRILDYILYSPGLITVLRELNLRRPGISGREIARLTGITHRSALKALDNLEALRLVERQVIGKAYSFTVNRKHYVYQYVIAPIFEAEKELGNSINNKIKKTLGKFSISIILFGSVARKEENYESDLDICIVYKSGRRLLEEKVSQLRGDLFSRYGISLAPYYISEKDFRSKAKNRKLPVINILREGRVISGKTITRMIDG
ncbi:MAG: nucleotidyltransferase domain-containing protein [Ignavibacteriales bacterium]|nr:nucleotidyltransferase domain-containing protein [Ignavibacteriales bacterium]